MVLSPKGEDKYEMKYVPEDFDRYDQGFFGRAKPEYIIVKFHTYCYDISVQ